MNGEMEAKGFTTPEIDCNLTKIGIPPATSLVFVIAKSFW
jgi:hypothetical protein